MNLITCSENCAYQKDGYCKLNNSATFNAVSQNGCNYYKKNLSKKSKNKK